MASKRIIICSDGTWNVADPAEGKAPTNVVKTARAILPRGPDGVEQLVFYDEGIGTKGKLDWLVGGHAGIGLSEKVLNAYRFLMDNWDEGDQVYLFGFSRGAFTVRSLAAFLGLYGLLPTEQEAALPSTWALFVAQGPSVATEQLAAARRGARHPFPVRMIGVWDTVDALGLPLPGLRRLTRPKLRFHDARLGGHVPNAFHAIAIDEIREAFRPTLWENDPESGQRIEQVWFPGVHVDCGGGRPEHGLSDLAWTWMLRRAEECGLGIDRDYERSEARPNVKQEIHPQLMGPYHLLPRYHRPILETNLQTERIHWSAVRRLEDHGLGYAPLNLRRALDAHGPAAVTDPSEDRAD